VAVEEEERMPKRFEDPIRVPTAVLDGLESVRESGEADMQDPREVQAVASRLGYSEVVAWIEDHPHEYREGIFRGFVLAEQPQA
jgi:Domain of unknown function (DUF5049)